MKKFESACVEVATLTQQLKELQMKYDEEVSETSRLKLALQQVGEKAKE